MIRSLPTASREMRRNARLQGARRWRRVFVPVAILNIEGHGRCLVVLRTLETRLSQRRGCRLWQVPA